MSAERIVALVILVVFAVWLISYLFGDGGRLG